MFNCRDKVSLKDNPSCIGTIWGKIYGRAINQSLPYNGNLDDTKDGMGGFYYHVKMENGVVLHRHENSIELVPETNEVLLEVAEFNRLALVKG